VACTIMTVNTTNRHDNSVCPYFPYFPIFAHPSPRFPLACQSVSRYCCTDPSGLPSFESTDFAFSQSYQGSQMVFHSHFIAIAQNSGRMYVGGPSGHDISLVIFATGKLHAGTVRSNASAFVPRA
jgi:hypothetical protein